MNEFKGVSCTSNVACIAVGDVNGESMAERWDGRRWSLQNIHFGDPQGNANELDGVSCTSRSTCAAVGFDDIGSCSGQGDYFVPVIGFRVRGRWSLRRNPNLPCSDSSSGGDQLHGVSCTSSRACTAVGDVTYRWNGRRWSIQKTHHALEGVSCSSNTFCTAVGFGIAARWNGSGWSIQTTLHLRGGDLTGVSCLATGACIAVGYTFRAGRVLPLAESTIGPAEDGAYKQQR